jgi:2,3-dihydroxybiphenyl 1,2-dioxygenase
MVTYPNDMISRESVTQLGYLGIGVSDLSGWRDFATNVLGLQESGISSTGSVFLRIDGYHHRFELFPSGEDDLLYTGWEVRDGEALRRVADQVRALGTVVIDCSAKQAAERKVIGLVRFADPDGLAVEVYFGPYRAASAFNSPSGLAGFKAEELGLGHIVLGVGDADAVLCFYQEGLGVKLSDYIYVERAGARLALTFTHVNPRHHSMALVQRPAAATGSARPKVADR